MHIAHLTIDLSESAGGVAQCVGSLCSSLSYVDGLKVSLLSGGFTEINQEINLERVSQIRVNTSSFRHSYRELVQLHSRQPISVIHDHGQWMPFNFASAWFARRFKIPRIVSPHGMLTEAARRHKWLKKEIAWRLYAKSCLRQASLIHATSTQERAQIETLVAKPTIIIPNGLNPPHNALELLERPRQNKIAFLGRLHPIKGLPELLSAWEKCEHADWTLSIAGPDETGFFRSRKAPDGVEVLGTLDSVSKFEFLSRSSVLILPSHSENFGIVVPEALCVGTPVIATHGTPWEMLAQENIGWWIELTVESLAKAMMTAMEMPKDRLNDMGRRGSLLVGERYAWKNIAQRFNHEYLSLIPKSTCPDRKRAVASR